MDKVKVWKRKNDLRENITDIGHRNETYIFHATSFAY